MGVGRGVDVFLFLRLHLVVRSGFRAVFSNRVFKQDVEGLGGIGGRGAQRSAGRCPAAKQQGDMVMTRLGERPFKMDQQTLLLVRWQIDQ